MSLLQRDFSSREALVDYLKAEFPQAAQLDPHISATRGGRKAALALLEKLDPVRYKSSRNFLNGAVTRLSPYIRHGVLSLAEVRDFALSKVRYAEQAEKLINELGWRDYFQRVYEELGEGIWQDREPYKTGFSARQYAQDLPADIRKGTTGLACIDAFAHELHQTGYLHNHARMWLAAYVVHWRRVRWQAGARWFLEHLLDGDPASNNLSWQWVASTFSTKPYIFNRDNLEKYTDGAYCRHCPLYGKCDFEGDYEQLSARLFKGQQARDAQTPDPRWGKNGSQRQAFRWAQKNMTQPALVWVHGDALSPTNPALQAYPNAPALFVFDEALLNDWRISLKRLVFMWECLLETRADLERGDVAQRLIARAKEQAFTKIATTYSPSPRWAKIVESLEKSGLAVEVHAPKPFLAYEGTFDLKRFSRYWSKAQRYAFGRYESSGQE